MSLTTRVLLGLVAGLAIGTGVSWLRQPTLLTAVSVVEPIGTLWVNAIRMTVIPLVVSLLITGIASDTARSVGKIGGRALFWFVALVAGGALLATLAAPLLLAAARFDATAIVPALQPGPSAQIELPPFRDWLVGLVPANPVRAAADGAMLPLIVFTSIVALAITRLEMKRRQVLLEFFDAVAKAMFVIVEWILVVAPIGVFFLVLPLAARTGAGLIGALGLFLVIVCGLLVVALVVLYPIATLAGGIPLRRFARACAPAQAVAFSTRSSLASLPAMLEGAERDLGLPERVSGIALPLAVSVFKYSSPVARLTGTLFVAQLYGIQLDAVEVAAIAAAIAALSFYSPGIPSGGLFIMAPIYMAFNLPIEGIGLLIALDLIPDMFITTANVTADMTVAVVLSRPSRPPSLDVDQSSGVLL
jgi:Na+/H+-dicarboxylate symporter